MDDELLDFEAIERNRYENMSFAKRVVLCSFTEILFQRKLLPDEAFKAIRLKGVKLFVFDADHDDAYENLVKLSTICEEIENEAVKILRFLINYSDDGKERVGEVFEIHFAYGDNITISLKLGDSIEHIKYNVRSHKKDFNAFIMRLRQFCRMLRDLPNGSYGRYHVVYNNGRTMGERGSEYFKKVVRAPLVWNGPKQDICAVVGTFNRKQIGLKMSVGTLFGTGATDSMALAEHLKEENWDEGGWDDQREYTQRKSQVGDKITSRHVSSRRKRMEEGKEDVVETDRREERYADQFDWNDDVDPVENDMSEIPEKVLKVIEEKTEKKEEPKEVKEPKNVQPKKRKSIEKKKKKEETVHSSDDGLGDEELSSNDSAHRGSEINLSTVIEVNEEAREKEGRMEMRRKRRKRMVERKEEKNTTLADTGGEWGVELADIEKVVEKSPGDSKSIPSSESSIKTPGQSRKRPLPTK